MRDDGTDERGWLRGLVAGWLGDRGSASVDDEPAGRGVADSTPGTRDEGAGRIAATDGGSDGGIGVDGPGAGDGPQPDPTWAGDDPITFDDAGTSEDSVAIEDSVAFEDSITFDDAGASEDSESSEDGAFDDGDDADGAALLEAVTEHETPFGSEPSDGSQRGGESDPVVDLAARVDDLEFEQAALQESVADVRAEVVDVRTTVESLREDVDRLVRLATGVAAAEGPGDPPEGLEDPLQGLDATPTDGEAENSTSSGGADDVEPTQADPEPDATDAGLDSAPGFDLDPRDSTAVAADAEVAELIRRAEGAGPLECADSSASADGTDSTESADGTDSTESAAESRTSGSVSPSDSPAEREPAESSGVGASDDDLDGPARCAFVEADGRPSAPGPAVRGGSSATDLAGRPGDDRAGEVRALVDPTSDAVGSRLRRYREEIGEGQGSADDGFRFRKVVLPAEDGGLPEVAGDDLSRPYLDALPGGYAAEAALIEWLDWLVSETDRETAARAIDYYATVDWLADEVAEQVVGYLDGVSVEGVGSTERPDGTPAAPEALDAQAHLRSLRYVTSLASGEVAADGV